jgi:hypothetical protein
LRTSAAITLLGVAAVTVCRSNREHAAAIAATAKPALAAYTIQRVRRRPMRAF